METNAEPMDPLSANATGLATQLESKYCTFRNASRLILIFLTKKDLPELRYLSSGSAALPGNENNLTKVLNFFFSYLKQEPVLLLSQKKKKKRCAYHE